MGQKTMTTRPGEENVATLFGDIHYFYGPPTENPPHHRFDKGSYVYLFENANDRRARLEIANQPGTEDQDAFDGFLDKTQVQYSYNHQSMVTLTVGETTDQMEWHLPTYDPHNQNKYHYKLHSLDIYFWKQDDALQFVNGIRRVLPPTQVEILDEPVPPSHHHHPQHHQQQQQQQGEPVSAVVQQLEHAAISNPDYGAQKQPHGQNGVGGAPSHVGPPPISAVPAQEPAAPASFAPMAYNPAAPAAPEAIKHREKTPPPDDGGIDPLAVAVAYDAQAPFSPGFVPPPGFQAGQVGGPGLPPPPPPPQFGGPPSQPGLQRAVTMPAQAIHGGLASPGLSSPYGGAFPGSPGFQAPPPPPPPQTQQQQQTTPQAQPQQQRTQQPTPPPQTPQSTPPVTSPGATPQTPLGGYSQYSYGSQQQQQQPGVVDYSVHQQLYRPTEQEAAKYNGYTGKAEPTGRLEQNAGRLERGVTGMLKRFEKKFG